MKKGIDVSRWQGNINWPMVKSAGVQFAIIKAGGADAGYYTDPCFEQNYTRAKAQGISVGAYYFTSANFTSASQGRLEAQKFLDIIKGKTFDYPVYVDVEAVSPVYKAGATQATIAFCEAMEQAGYYVGIYASDVSGFHDRLDIRLLNAYSKWVARYGSKPQYVTSYDMWQYSSTGRISGINASVDMNYSYKDFDTIIKNAGLNGYSKTEPAKKTIDELAQEVLAGKWGNGAERQRLLTAAGYDYAAVQARVNELVADKPKYSTYVVRKGDTLTSIARLYNTTVQKIAIDNNIKNINLIYPGQILKIYK